MKWFARSPREVPATVFPGEALTDRSTRHQIDVICTAYRRPGQLRVLVQCLLNQTDHNWTLHVLHDGPDQDFDEVASSFSGHAPQVRFTATEERAADYGHSLRARGLAASKGEFVLITNDDNYYPPRFLEFVNTAISACQPDVVMYDMVHSHTNPGRRRQLSHCFFEVHYVRWGIDMGAAVVRGDLAREAGFHDRAHDADATYFEDVARVTRGHLRVTRIPRVLLYHN